MRPNFQKNTLRTLLFRVLTLLFIVGLSACGGGDGTTNNGTTAPQTLTGSVVLMNPPDSTVIYASTLYVAGTSADLPGSRFLLRLADSEGASIAETTVTAGDDGAGASDGAWTVELVHGYTGDPTEATLLALPVPDAGTGESPAGQYAAVTLLLSGIEHRPEGMYLDILFPTEGAEAGGDFIQVDGRISGMGGALTVELVGSDGATLDTKTVEITNPYQVDDIPWSAELAPGEFVGSAVINVRLADSELSDAVPIILTSAAG